jgi:hypothetical protein
MSENYFRIDNGNRNSESAATKKREPCYMMLYSITHIIIAFFAIYLSWKCNQKNGVLSFNPLQFMVALFCPHFYIIWALAMKGGCDVF